MQLLELLITGGPLLLGKAAYIDSVVGGHKQISLLKTEQLSIVAQKWVVNKHCKPVNKATYTIFRTAQSVCFV